MSSSATWRPTAGLRPRHSPLGLRQFPPRPSTTRASPSGRWTSTRFLSATPRSPSSTNSLTPTRRTAATSSATRTSRNSSTPVYRSTRPSTSSTSRARTMLSPRSPVSGSQRRSLIRSSPAPTRSGSSTSPRRSCGSASGQGRSMSGIWPRRRYAGSSAPETSSPCGSSPCATWRPPPTCR